MSNITTFMENGTYNLTKIVSSDAIDNPTSWINNFNVEMGGFFILGVLLAAGVLLFWLARNLDGVKDTEAASASGLIMSVIATLLYFVETSSGGHLLIFDHLMVILVITGVSVFLNFINR